MTLSGGMKRRVLIAKALSHEPRSCSSTSRPPASTSSCAATCGQLVRALRERGVTIILTTHYIEEAEEMADRIGVINNGEIMLVEDKAELMRKLGRKQLTLHLQRAARRVPAARARPYAGAVRRRHELVYTYDTQAERTGIAGCCADLREAGIRFRDLHTPQSSLEEIFVKPGEEAA
jgi:ABC-2 type transport system ATP-binding protein